MASKKKKPVAKKAVKKTAKKASSKSLTKKISNATFFQPLGDRVLVERDEASTKTPSGLFIPDTAGDAPTHGTVISAGPGYTGKKGKLRPTTVKPGNRVMFAKFSGDPIKLDGKEYLILRETDIIGVIEN